MIKRMFFIIILLCLFFSNVFGQDKKTIVIKKYDVYKKFEKKEKVFSEFQIDSLINYDHFIKFDYASSSSKIIKAVTNGMRVNFTSNLSLRGKEVIGEASYLPIWEESISDISFGVGVSYIKLPFELNLNIGYSQINLDKEKKRFPYPPLNPSGTEIEHKLNLFSLDWSFNWVPLLMSLKPLIPLDNYKVSVYLYPTIGIVHNYTLYSYNGRHNGSHNYGLEMNLYLRHRLFYAKVGYQKFIFYEENIQNRLQLQIGVWFSLMK